MVEDIAKNTEKKYQKLMQELNDMKPGGGKKNSQKFWKMKKRMSQKNNDPPTALLDAHGILLTSNNAIKDRALEVYTDRLKNNKIAKHLEAYEDNVNELCAARFKQCKQNKVDPWTMEDLEIALN